MASELELTDEQLKLLRDLVSYARSNVDDVNDACDSEYNDASIEELEDALGFVNPKTHQYEVSFFVTFNSTNVPNYGWLTDQLETAVKQGLGATPSLDELGPITIDDFEVRT